MGTIAVGKMRRMGRRQEGQETEVVRTVVMCVSRFDCKEGGPERLCICDFVLSAVSLVIGTTIASSSSSREEEHLQSHKRRALKNSQIVVSGKMQQRSIV